MGKSLNGFNNGRDTTDGVGWFLVDKEIESMKEKRVVVSVDIIKTKFKIEIQDPKFNPSIGDYFSISDFIEEGCERNILYELVDLVEKYNCIIKDREWRKDKNGVYLEYKLKKEKK